MAELRFHEEHCWVRAEDDTALIGITDYAQNELGKIIYIGLPEEGEVMEEGEPYGEIESRKVVSDLIAPVNGEVVEVNLELEDEPAIINESPYNEGWIVRVKLSDPGEVEALMDEAKYLSMVSG